MKEFDKKDKNIIEDIIKKISNLELFLEDIKKKLELAIRDFNKHEENEENEIDF